MTLEIGDRFNSHNNFENALKIFKDANFVDFYISDSRTLDNAKTKYPRKINSVVSKEDIKYYYVKYKCILGGKYKRSKDCKGVRKTKTYRQGCPAFIQLVLSEDSQSLEIRSMDKTHNHEISPEIYHSFTKVRRLSPSYKKVVMDYVNLNADRRFIQNKIRKDTGKLVTMKDIKNIIARDRAKLKSSNEIPEINWDPLMDLHAISSQNLEDISSNSADQTIHMDNTVKIGTSSMNSLRSILLTEKPIEKQQTNKCDESKLDYAQALCSLSKAADKDELFGAYVGQALQEIKNERNKELCRLEIQNSLFKFKFADS